MPAKLPTGWIRLTMGDVGRWVGGGTPSKANPRYWTTGTIPWVSPKDMKSDTITDTQDHITEEAVSESATNLVEAGSVLIVVRSGILQHTLPVAVARRKVALNQDIKAVNPSEIIRSDYLAFALKTFEQDILHTCTKTGTTVQSLELPVFLRFSIPVAPFPEQERIVAKLNPMLARVAKGEAAARRALHRLQRYRAAVLHAAVTGELTRKWRKTYKPEETGSQLLKRILAERHARWEETELKRLHAVGKPPNDDKWKKRYPEPKLAKTAGLEELPQGWVWTSVDQLATGEPGAIQSGPFGSQLQHSEFVKRGILAIGIDNVLEGRFSLGREHRITAAKYAQLKKFTARPLDVVITVMATVGRVCVLPEDLEKAIITKHCYRISPSSQFVNSDYLAFALRADSATREHIFGNIRGQTRAGINGSILKVAPVSLPPLSEQAQIVGEVHHRLAAADRLAATLNRQLERAVFTRQSLLREAFAGNLVAQNPNDESASVLLERIRATREVEAKKPITKRMPKAKSKIVHRPLLDVLHEHKKPISPEQLFREAGFQPGEADAFYRELTALRKQLLEQKPKGPQARAWPQREKVLLKLKEH